MNHIPTHLPQILNHTISGYHQYDLSGTPRPVFLSENLCDMLELPKAVLFDELEDRYAQRIHPSDREAYQRFLAELRREPQTRTAQYRLLRGDGSILYVCDTMTSYLHGTQMLADSVLTDITRLKAENRNLQYLNDTTPCAFLKYTCEKNPRVTFMNDRMLEILGFSQDPRGEYDDLALYKSNIYTMIPSDERGRFSRYLERVSEQGGPIAGEMTALKQDGSRIHVFGWVTKCVNERGEEEFQSAFMDITQRYREKKELETSRYLKALTEVYDKVFEFDLRERTVKCLYGQNSPSFKWLEHIPMQMQEATEKWITGSAAEADRERLRRFFGEFYRRKLTLQEDRPPQITYRALSSSGSYQTYSGIFLMLDQDTSLYCCRRATEVAEPTRMQELAMRFTEGVVAFEVEGDRVKPLYISENVCSFFGYDRDEWVALTEKKPTIREFIDQSGIRYSEVKTLFSAGESEFTYFDMERNAYRRIRAICSGDYQNDGKCYVMLYHLDTNVPERAQRRVRIRTFGYFDVFVDDKPIAFRNEKSKELLALLVDRRGGFVSSEEAISFLWEDEPANTVTLSRYRKVALRLKNLLEEYGISEIVESVNGKRRIAAEKVACDLYDYLTGREEYAQLFKGSYLSNYSWGETTLAELTGEHLYAAGV